MSWRTFPCLSVRDMRDISIFIRSYIWHLIIIIYRWLKNDCCSPQVFCFYYYTKEIFSHEFQILLTFYYRCCLCCVDNLTCVCANCNLTMYGVIVWQYEHSSQFSDSKLVNYINFLLSEVQMFVQLTNQWVWHLVYSFEQKSLFTSIE